MHRMLPTFTAMAAALLCGAVHGIWTDRWHLSDEPAASAARLSQVSLQLGDWEGEAMTPEGKQFKSAAGHLYHRYTHRPTGKKVTVFIACDRPGPVSIHTPNVCYEAVGFEVGKPTRYAPKLAAAEAANSFWTARFHKKNATAGADLRIYWAWSAAGEWDAADDPRLAFARYPALFKLYMIRESAAADEPLDQDPCVQLMQQLLPELRRVLFAPS